MSKKHGLITKDFSEDNWQELKSELIKYLKNEPFYHGFEYAYRLAYPLVFYKQGEKLYDNVKEIIKSHLIEIARPNIIRAPMFLTKLIECWKNFTKSMKMFDGCLLLLNRMYIRKKGLLNFVNLGQHLFRDEIILYQNVNDRMKAVISEMTELNRKVYYTITNVKIEFSGELKSVSEMLLELGGDNQNFYENQFVKLFFQNSLEFCKSETIKYLNNGCEYVRRTNKCLKDEEKFAEIFLDPSALSKLMDILISELITVNVQKILNMENNGIVYMLENDSIEELNILQNFIKRVPIDFNLDVSSIIKHIQDRYSIFLDKINEFLSSHNFLKYTENLLHLNEELKMFMEKYFNVENQLSAKVQDEIRHFIKPDPQLLSLYIDHFLKKGTTKLEENETFDILEKAMNIFKFLLNKDVFEIYYKKHLAKRLLLNKSSSNDAEKFVITRLKNECGINFTQKIEAMLKDIEISKDLMSKCKETNEDKNDTDLNVQVLTKSYWPISDIHSCILPISAEIAFNKFKSFYYSKHSGRILSINPNFGFADLKATFYKKNNTKETKLLTVTTFQMCILMKFNESEFFTFEKLLNQTKINEKDLKRALESMAMGKKSQRILTRSGDGIFIENADIFSVNDDFTSKLNRIKIQMIPLKNEKNELEQKEIFTKINDDRKHEIEAAIIRVMKSRQKFIHNELITEVTKILQSRFLPDPTIIKKRIGALIEREYLKRDENDLNIYRYIS